MKRRLQTKSKRKPVRLKSVKESVNRGELRIGKSSDHRNGVVRCIRALPTGTVSSYGAIARAAGWPGGARQVVQILHRVPGLPWHRVVGSGGAIKLTGESGAEQRFRLQMEGVKFRGARVDMARHEFRFPKKRFRE